MSIVSIDPGTMYSAYALFKEPRLNSPAQHEVFLSHYGLIRAKTNEKDWALRAEEIAAKLGQAVMLQHKPSVLVIEFPCFQGGERGFAAARAGDTLKLAYLCGILSMMWKSYAAMTSQQKELVQVHRPVLISPMAWKDALPKHIVRQRVNETFHLELQSGIEENISDAIGLGQFFLAQTSTKLVELKPPERVDV